MKQVPVTVWYGCYDRQWSGAIIPDAFKHPAKFSRNLVERLLDYGIERGWWAPGQRLGDPFGGVACGSIPAADRGFEWIGSELEEQFVGIGNRNIDSHAHKWRTMNRPIPRLVQGDSRNFAAVVQGIVTSPPFSAARGGAQGIAVNGVATERRTDQRMRDRTYLGEDGERDPANIEKLEPGKIDFSVTSPPYAAISAGAGGLNHLPAKEAGQQSGRKHAGSQDTDQRYGDNESQIAKLPSGNIDAAVTSPPHGNTMRGQKDGIDWEKAKREASGGGEHQKQGASLHATYGENDPANIGRLGGVVTSPPWGGEKASAGHVGADKFADTAKAAAIMANSGKGHSASPEARQRQFERDKAKSYGTSPGQIGTLDGGFTSPPYDKSNQDYVAGAKTIDWEKGARKGMKNDQLAKASYGDNPNQVGRAAGETYWDAMRKVYASCFEAIKPGGYMAVVVKDYVRNWKRVPLCDDTMRLLEFVGFDPVERIHAMVTEVTEHSDLFEGTTTTKKERKSFFRRLQESKGAPAIDYEEVLIVRKPPLAQLPLKNP